VWFGQEREKKIDSSPKKGTLRTGKREKERLESEEGYTSDRKERKRAFRVRRVVHFGQEREKKSVSSPKSGPLRTGKREKERFESEEWSTSDRKGRKRAFRVRRRVHFGQEREKKSVSSPKKGPLRTGKREKERFESEEGTTSDRKERKRAFRVRRRVHFGQEREKKSVSSPKKGPLRTGKREKERFESEEGSTSDRKERKRAIPGPKYQ
jgi:hypothetical protein